MTAAQDILVKRIYEPADAGDGARFLVDRLWPRGVSKDKADLTAWLKALSPSSDLRIQFHEQEAAGGRKAADEAWSAFRRAYFAELDAGGPDIAAALDQLRAVKGRVTLLYGARDEERNNATALLEWLKRDVKNGA
ncbi:MAG: hypothetical protein CVT74_08360 [Alphaproteobacteria bacterium HGW-Alphaproteobacteria-13]|jgi:uncharacterized protein YeaO (DUF488 family)|nr:MAG: hypothetical protein CVT74_08360 [Alphaproteobacteria bacterium HGW-Alphaproteobacteria-13]